MKQNDFYEVDGCTDFIPVKLIEEHKHIMNALELEVAESGFRTFAPNIYKFPKVDEPQKVTVPQFVANWYEEHKDDLSNAIGDFYINYINDYFTSTSPDFLSGFLGWFSDNSDTAIETLVKMKIYGYEVEKEKLYIVRNKTTGEHLYFNNAKKRFESGSLLTSYVKNIKAYHHTQDKLEKLNYWGNSLFEFEEVEK